MKHMTIRLATIVLMLTTLIPTKAQQTQWLYDGLFYHINDDGTCSVVSTLKTGEIVIPQVAVIEGKNYIVTAILEGAFQSKDKITSIDLPNSVTSIGEYAFLGCTGLTTIKLPDALAEISTGTFSLCTGLTSVALPSALSTIGSEAFYNCTGLISLHLPNLLTSIGDHAFFNCSNLAVIAIPNTLESIGDDAFLNCTELKDINLDRVSQIKYGAFANCKGLLNVSIFNAKDVNSDAFINSSISSAVLPYEWTENFKLDFSKTPNLWKVYIGEATATIPPDTFKSNKLFWIYSNATTPPEISTTTFSPDTYDKGILYVPQGCLNAYKGAKVWNLIPDIRELPYQIDIPSEKVSVDISQSVTLTASVVPAYGPPVQIKWYSLNEDIATVTSEGIVTGVSEGKATIVACGDGITASKEVTVINVMTPGAVEDIATDTPTEGIVFDVYNLQGIRVATGIDNAEFSAAGLAPGIYILVSPHGCRKVKL